MDQKETIRRMIAHAEEQQFAESREYAFKSNAQQKRELAEEHNLEYVARQIEEKSFQMVSLEMMSLRSGGVTDAGPRGLYKPDPTNAKRAVIGLPNYTELQPIWPE